MGFAAAAGAAGGVISAIGAIREGNAQAAEARYQAQVAENNKTIALQNAGYATQAGEERAYETGLRARATGGRQTAELAASGLDINTGSAAKVRAGTLGIGELEQEQTRANAALTSYGYRSQAMNYGAQASLLKSEAPLDVTSGYLKAAGALLGSSSNLPIGKWSGLG